MVGEGSSRRRLRRLAPLGAALLMWCLGSASVNAATGWWQSAPGPPRILSAVASNSTYTTLAISGGVAGWLDSRSGNFALASSTSKVAFVAAKGDSGLILESTGELYTISSTGAPQRLQRLPGRPLGLAISAGANPVAAALTNRGVYRGELGSRLRLVASAFPLQTPLTLAGPVTSSEPFALATAHGVFLLGSRGPLRRVQNSPRLGAHAHIAELGNGTILVGDDRGLISAYYRGRWTPIFQLLPYGGLGGVPQLDGIVGVGLDAAYVATSGFGTLLTPDGGYSWYRASPPSISGTILALATLGPIYGTRPVGLVLAVSPSRVFLHRLEALPTPPIYSGATETAQLWGTALVTALAAALVICLMWLIRRRHRRRLFV